MRLLRRGYGATPVHLAAHVAALALAGYALLQLVDVRSAGNVFTWLIGAVLLHDFVLLPLYGALDRAGQALAGERRWAVNYLRVPAALSGLLLLVYFPLIFGLSDGNVARASAIEPAGYAGRWLLVTGILFAASAVLVAIRLRHRKGIA
jgi:hypothetical protein